MAGLDRLSPPNLAGTLPSFYTKADGTTTLVVPFTMSSMVTTTEVAGYAVRIKTTTTDSLIAVQYKTKPEEDSSGMQISFDLPTDVVRKLVEGDFYKVQLAYYNLNADDTPYIGYYSTAAVVKYTCLPHVYIQGLVEGGIINSTTARSFSGIYTNEDISEKVYQYRFILLGVDELAQGTTTETLVDTGWTVHDSSEDTELGKSTDLITISEAMIVGKTYLLTYSVRTVNGLEYYGPTYTIVSVANIGVVLPFCITHELDYDNGAIKVHTRSNYWSDPEKVKNANQLNMRDQEENPLNWRFNGSYQLLRTDSNSNYRSWIPIFTFTSSDLFSNWEYIDYTVESGVGYKYGIERINKTEVKSRRSESAQPIVAYFEDMFLYDGNRQLKIRFNSNVSSFKEVISETKKTTLGRKYPIIMRNGTLQYKEFQITGLLSYLSDPDELFITKKELLSEDILRDANTKDKTIHKVFVDTTDITDVNVASERNFAIEALSWLNNGEIKLFRSSQEGNYIVKLTNVSLAPEATTGRMLHTFTATASEIAKFSFDQLLAYHLVSENDGGAIWQTKVERFYIHNVREQLRQQLGSNYTGNDLSREVARALEAIDMTGGYPCIKIVIYSPEGANQAKIMGTQFEWGKYHWAVGPSNRYTIELDKPYEAALYLVNANGLSDAGIVEMTLMKNVATIEEATEKQYVATMYGWSMYGTDELDGNGYTSNSLYELSTHKRAVVAEYSMEIHSYPVITQSGMASWWASSANAAQVAQFKLLYDQWVFYYDPDNGKYYRWNGSSLVEQPYNIYIKARDQSKDEFVTPINIQAMQSGAVLPEINYDDPDDIYLSMTNAVFVQLYYQTQSTEYTIESTLPALQDKAKNVKESYETWAAYAFNMEKVNTANSSQMNSPYLFIFTDDGRFAQIDKATYNDKYTNRNCYRPYSGIFSKQSIQNARQLYRTHLASLDEALELNLQEG